MIRPLLVAAALVVAVPAASAAASSSPTSAHMAQSARVGSVAVHRCDLGLGKATWCGSVPVALDPTDRTAGTIRIGFGWAPASDGNPAAATIAAMEGGPGYPSTGSAPDFAGVFGPLLQHRNLLVVDARGTGRSAVIDCPDLQTMTMPPKQPAFLSAVAACGRQLNHTFRRSDGSYVHASDLFTTANSARDLAQVTTALSIPKFSLYGDSYGTYFSQSFLSRYPGRLDAVVLDSAYEARDLDPWYTTTVTTARTAFDAVCRRAAACSQATRSLGTTPWQRISALAAQLRRHPVHGTTVDTNGRLTTQTVDVTSLVNIVNDAGYDFTPYQQLDAAARAYLEHRDAQPLLRLWARDIGFDYGNEPASYVSQGLYMAVACTDYPQLFDMTSSERARKAQLQRSIAAEPKGTFAPFTTREWLTVVPFTESYTGCLSWPKPTHPVDPPVPPGVPMDRTHVPVLILNGDLDSLTPAAGGRHVARQIGSAARSVVVPNLVHLVALDNPYGCGRSIVQRFLTDPARLHELDTSCAGSVPEIRAVGRYPATVAEALPASGAASLDVRRLASVAVAAAGDAARRFNDISGRHDRGLRGGSVTYNTTNGLTTGRLNDVRWTTDSTATGWVRSADNGLSATARVVVAERGATPMAFVVSWPGTKDAQATIRTGHTVLTVPAP